MLNLAPVLAFVAAVAVSAAPNTLVLNGALLTTGHDHVAHVHHFEHVAGKTKLRFVHLVPKLAHAGNVDEFASRKTVGGHNRVHPFLNVAHDELFVELLGLSDCATFHGALLVVEGAAGLVHRAVGWAVDFAPVTLAVGVGAHAVTALAAFLFGRFPREHFVGLLGKGLPAHPLTTALHRLLK